MNQERACRAIKAEGGWKGLEFMTKDGKVCRALVHRSGGILFDSGGEIHRFSTEESGLYRKNTSLTVVDEFPFCVGDDEIRVQQEPDGWVNIQWDHAIVFRQVSRATAGDLVAYLRREILLSERRGHRRRQVAGFKDFLYVVCAAAVVGSSGGFVCAWTLNHL